MKEFIKSQLIRFPIIFSNPIIRYIISNRYKRLWTKRNKYIKLNSLSLETTSICNAKCEMCAHRKMVRLQMTMSHNDFARLVEIAKRENLNTFYFGGLGEFLLDKEIFRKLDLLVEKGIILGSITTNASVLDEQMSLKLLKYPLKTFHISIDGATKETYESIRHLPYEKVIENIRIFLNLRKKLNRLDIGVRMQMTVFEKNRHEVKPFIETWKGYLIPGIDDFGFLNASNYAGLTGIEYEKRGIRIPCGRVWNKQILVAVNGDVCLCCWDYNVNNNIGNVLAEGSFEKIWNNAKMQHIRNLHISGNFKAIPLCEKCNDNNFVKSYYKLKPV